MGCGKFAMGYLDDIIIFSKNEIEHLQRLQEARMLWFKNEKGEM